MPDNTQLSSGTGGDLIATDELTTLNGSVVSGVKVQRVKVGYGADGDLKDVTVAEPLPVEEIDADTGLQGGFTNYRERVIAQRYTLLADSIADGLATFWTSTVANGGTTAVSTGEGFIQTSANAAGSAQLVSTIPAYLPGQSAWSISAARFGDTGSVGNIRRIGVFTVSGTTPQDGFYYELNGTTLNAVTCRAGTATSVAVGSWTRNAVAPFTLDANYHLYELRWTGNRADFYIDNVLRHTVSGTTAPITNTLNFPMTMQNINTSGATNRVLAVRNIGMGRFGTQDVATVAGNATKGVQPVVAMATQDMKDSGRNARHFMLDAYTVAPAAEALQSVVQWYNNTAVAATTTPAVVPAGKTLRLTTWSLSTKSLATVGSAVVRVRVNTAGVGALASPLVFSFEAGSRSGATTTAMTGGLDSITGVFPEGFEIPAGAGIAFSMAGYGPAGALAAQGVTRFAVYGYEF